MDFTTTHSTPIKVTVNGTAYDVPRFLMPQLQAWAASRQKKAMDEALAQFGDDAETRARFLAMFQPAPVDVLNLLEDATAPDGVDYVLRDRLKAAGVPADVLAAMLAHGDPALLRNLARLLLTADRARSQLATDSGDEGRADPLAGSPPESGDSPTTTSATSEASAPPASTQAA